MERSGILSYGATLVTQIFASATRTGQFDRKYRSCKTNKHVGVNWSTSVLVCDSVRQYAKLYVLRTSEFAVCFQVE